MLKLATDSLKGGVFFIVALAAMIFLPAFTFNYWQAWVYLAVFAICCFLITVYLLKNDTKLLESRIKVGVTAESQKDQKIIQGFVSLFVIATVSMSGLDHRFQWSVVPLLYVAISEIFVIFGFLTIFQVFKTNTHTAATIKVDKKQKVVSSGPYSLVRHPMYFGALLIFFATPIALGSYWGLIFSILLTGTMVIRLLNEEKYLSKNLPGYREYCHKIKKHLIPFVW